LSSNVVPFVKQAFHQDIAYEKSNTSLEVFFSC